MVLYANKLFRFKERHETIHRGFSHHYILGQSISKHIEMSLTRGNKG